MTYLKMLTVEKVTEEQGLGSEERFNWGLNARGLWIPEEESGATPDMRAFGVGSHL